MPNIIETNQWGGNLFVNYDEITNNITYTSYRVDAMDFPKETIPILLFLLNSLYPENYYSEYLVV